MTNLTEISVNQDYHTGSIQASYKHFQISYQLFVTFHPTCDISKTPSIDNANVIFQKYSLWHHDDYRCLGVK